MVSPLPSGGDVPFGFVPPPRQRGRKKTAADLANNALGIQASQGNPPKRPSGASQSPSSHRTQKVAHNALAIQASNAPVPVAVFDKNAVQAQKVVEKKQKGMGKAFAAFIAACRPLFSLPNFAGASRSVREGLQAIIKRINDFLTMITSGKGTIARPAKVDEIKQHVQTITQHMAAQKFGLAGKHLDKLDPALRDAMQAMLPEVV